MKITLSLPVTKKSFSVIPLPVTVMKKLDYALCMVADSTGNANGITDIICVNSGNIHHWISLHQPDRQWMALHVYNSPNIQTFSVWGRQKCTSLKSIFGENYMAYGRCLWCNAVWTGLCMIWELMFPMWDDLLPVLHMDCFLQKTDCLFIHTPAWIKAPCLLSVVLAPQNMVLGLFIFLAH